MSDPTMRNLTSRVKHLNYIIITWSLPNPAATKTTATPWCWRLPPTNAMRSATTSRFGHHSQGFRGIHTVCPRSEQPLQSHETLSQCLVRWFVDPASGRSGFGLIPRKFKKIQKNPRIFWKKFWKFPGHFLWGYPGPHLACSGSGPPPLSC